MLREFRKILIFGFLIGTQFNSIGQNFAELEANLIDKFPNDSIVGDNVWAFFKETANIQKIKKPIVKKYLDNYEFYNGTLTNFMGYHIEETECLIIYDSITSHMKLFPPIWFDSSMENFFNKFSNTEFESKSELKNFISQIQEIMLIGSSRKSFENTQFYPQKITFDLMETRDSKKKIWRKMIVKIMGNRILKLKSKKPVN